jgi:hypothetical protein
MVLMAAGIVLSFTMRPDRALEVEGEEAAARDARKFV